MYTRPEILTTACCRERSIALRSMESTSNHYYSITKRMLSLAGQWPYQERRTRLFLVSFVTATTVSMIVPMVP
ncbi:Odorant receptor [Temnothorax longispinosus]|uniref:Odorant receptor n=1 Tax=Temnothorax longispinosus TaxID=300112 RepID=A0A4S2KS64_9HYME|nr:Odorant receptor [Temnothorax longispinosus]